MRARALIVALTACALAVSACAADDPEGQETTAQQSGPASPSASAAPSEAPSAAPSLAPGMTATVPGALAGAPEPGAAPELSNRPRQALPQTSDGEVGAIAPLVPFGVTQRTYTTLSNRRIVPGVRFERFTITDFRGQIRGQLLRVNPHTRGVHLDYVGRPHVTSVAPLGALLDRHAVAAVNGDFFDIEGSGAPLGVGRDAQRGALHGVRDGWTSALYQDQKNRWHIGPIGTSVRIAKHPELRVTAVNSPLVRPGQIAMYTDKWGESRNYRVVDGRGGYLRIVVVRGGRVVSTRVGLPSRVPPRAQMFVGHGRGADQLARLKVGMRIVAEVQYAENPRVVLTGNTRILFNDERLTVDDVEMHPRTSVGINRKTGEILLLVVDGRQSFSRGLTMVELANLMRELGADDAINLDGGGSSTMIGLNPHGRRTVLNSPSDGRLRPIPNGLEVLYARR